MPFALRLPPYGGGRGEKPNLYETNNNINLISTYVLYCI